MSGRPGGSPSCRPRRYAAASRPPMSCREIRCVPPAVSGTKRTAKGQSSRVGSVSAGTEHGFLAKLDMTSEGPGSRAGCSGWRTGESAHSGTQRPPLIDLPPAGCPCSTTAAFADSHRPFAGRTPLAPARERGEEGEKRRGGFLAHAAPLFHTAHFLPSLCSMPLCRTRERWNGERSTPRLLASSPPLLPHSGDGQRPSTYPTLPSGARRTARPSAAERLAASASDERSRAISTFSVGRAPVVICSIHWANGPGASAGRSS